MLGFNILLKASVIYFLCAARIIFSLGDRLTVANKVNNEVKE